MSEVAIFSTGIDEPTYGPVAEKLVLKGYEVWVYDAGRVTSGFDELSASFDDQGDLLLTYNGIERRMIETHSAWYRHPNILGLILSDKAKQLSIEQEITNLQESFWQAIPVEAWLNNPARMKLAQAKLGQLSLAKHLGFEIPTTAISNNWQAIEETLDVEDMIVKMSQGVLYDDNQTRVLYTTLLSKDDRKKLEHVNPFPGIYQQLLQKSREWRITVVGDEVFEAAIYTTEDAKDDWRRHQLTSKVEFKSQPFPDIEKAQCIDYLKAVGLTYGAFDFIEDDEGRIVFLECNTNGQYKWVEDLLGLPISDAVVDTLVRRLKDN